MATLKSLMGEEFEPPRISSELKKQLLSVPASRHRDIEYRPCAVKTKQDGWFYRTYVVRADTYIKHWGIWPWSDKGKSYVPLDQVVQIEESTQRIPPRLANMIHGFGESGMGYVLFTLVLDDGSEVPCVAGGAVDFPALPSGVTPSRIVDVKKGAERDDSLLESLPYAWCLYVA